MLVVGLTGGIATGKSTTAKMFQELGAILIDADQIAHKLLEVEQPTWQKVAKHFGPGFLQADRQINRKKLLEEIFNNELSRLALNAIVHPPVVAQIEKEIKDISTASPDAIIIADIPLLFEVEWPFEWDKIIVTICTQANQFIRFKERDPKMNQLKFKKCLRTQLPIEEKAARADWVINTNGDLQKTQGQASKVYQELLKLERQG